MSHKNLSWDGCNTQEKWKNKGCAIFFLGGGGAGGKKGDYGGGGGDKQGVLC